MADVATIISSETIRRFILGKQGLWPGRRWRGEAGTAKALRELEAVQLDPVTIVAPSHHIVLWGRVIDYTPVYLDQLLYQKRQFFDYGGALFIRPMDELPYWRLPMERRKSQKRWSDFSAANAGLLDVVRREVEKRGPLRNRDLAGENVDNYRGSKDTSVALYYLWLTGELMTHHREGKERVYEFLDKVAPRHLRRPATVSDAEDYFAMKAIALRGMVTGRVFRKIWSGFIQRPVGTDEADQKLRDLVEGKSAAEVKIKGKKGTLLLLRSDLPILSSLQEGEVPKTWMPSETTTEEEVVFLSPLEYVSARGRAMELFGFEYVWEIYKPAAQRKWGPYVMPILYRDRLVARMDAKLDRDEAILRINGFWLENGIKADKAFVGAFAAGLMRFGRFLEVTNIDVTALNPKPLRRSIQNAISAEVL